MAIRIAGITLPNKRMEVALTYVYGIGRPTSNRILQRLNIDKNLRPDELSQEDVNQLRNIIEKELRIEGELRREIISNIKRLKDITCYRGTRHIKHLPAHGQRTKTNSRTIRGNVRRTAGSGRKSAPAAK